MIKNIINKINSRELKICVVGLGYVGLPLAVEFASEGFIVNGIDLDSNKVNKINRGENYIQDVDNAKLKECVDKGFLTASTDYSSVAECQAVSICVPTPLRKTKDPDVSYIIHARDEIKKFISPGTLVILESTTYPGTTEELLLPEFESKGLVAGKDLFLAFSPERVDPGNPVYHTSNTPKVIGGITPQCNLFAKTLYGTVIETIIEVSSPRSAETVKLLENTFRSVNIGLVNEIAIMCKKLNIDVWEVIDAASTKPFGFMPFYPGPGLGGHCIPIDPHYFSWKLKTVNYNARFIELAGEINSHMPDYVIDQLTEILNTHKKPVNGSKILIYGVAYKKNIDDVRESPALDIISLLYRKNAEVSFYDPYIPMIKTENGNMNSLKEQDINFNEYDAVLIITDHKDLPKEKMISQSKIILDTRNALKIKKDNIYRI